MAAKTTIGNSNIIVLLFWLNTIEQLIPFFDPPSPRYSMWHTLKTSRARDDDNDDDDDAI